ncbi:phage major capsid protein [Prescottella equi]|uniref:phage major capsid protein n=1 Tax=Rhodococcus hoagii TaxID=43767 RepID=UPI0007CD7C9F|nr:hypothetical protein [Prescottella equi]OQQ28707.1 hypothetical protein A4U94_01285 [Prescottella equi]
MTTNLVSVTDGGGITVSDLVANPMFVPTKLKELMENQFISEALFRNAGSNKSSIVKFTEGDPTFLEGDVQDVAEFGEIPVSHGRRGEPRIAIATKRALGVRISKEMQDENDIDAANKQMTGLRNTFVRANDRAAKAVLMSSAVPTMPVSKAWDDVASKPRTDIVNAVDEISNAAPNEAQGGSEDEYFGFEPDTIVVNTGLLATLMDNEDILKVYQGNIADQNIAYTGALPAKIYGLNVIQSRTFPRDRALILQRGVAGFYSDSRPLTFTALYPEGGGPNGGPTETWRSDASIKRAIGLDQPKAALWLTGLVTP